MAKEFNPDDFLEKTAPIVDVQQEDEKRKQAEVEKQAAIAQQTPGEQAGNYITQSIIPTAFGVGAAGLDLAGQALSNPIIQKGLEYGGAGLAAKKFLVNPVLESLKPVGQAVGQHVTNVTDALNRQAAAAEASEQGIANRAAARAGQPVAQAAQNIRAPIAPQGAPTAPMQAPVAQSQPSIIQRGMDMASRMRQAAAQRVVGFGASGAAVPAGVAAGGAAATGLAGGQMAAMTPEQRKAYYDSMMLGAMGGDAGLAAAIMNRGQ